MLNNPLKQRYIDYLPTYRLKWTSLWPMHTYTYRTYTYTPTPPNQNAHHTYRSITPYHTYASPYHPINHHINSMQSCMGAYKLAVCVSMSMGLVGVVVVGMTVLLSMDDGADVCRGGAGMQQLLVLDYLDDTHDGDEASMGYSHTNTVLFPIINLPSTHRTYSIHIFHTLHIRHTQVYHIHIHTHTFMTPSIIFCTSSTSL